MSISIQVDNAVPVSDEFVLNDSKAVTMIRSDRSARAFVWSVWFVMMLVALVFLVKYGQVFPITEDWLVVPALTGNEPHMVQWLWAQVNEHRVPFPKLLLLFLLKATHGDFRIGMIFNILTLGLLSTAMIYVARYIRGGRTSFVDAFFPVALLHLGHAENLFWSWQVTVVIPTVLACIMLLVLVANHDLTTPFTAVVAGTSLVLLPLSGLNGIIYAPALAVWLGYHAVLRWRETDRKEVVRWPAMFLLLSAICALGLTALYFVGYERPSWVPRPSGVDVWLQTTLNFLALGFGPSAANSWLLSVIAAMGILVSSAMLAIWGVLRSQGQERQRALGILLFLGTLVVFAVGIGWGRAGAIPLFGHWPLRYCLFAVPVLCTAFYIWELYGPGVLRKIVQGTLFVIMCIALPLNTTLGLSFLNWYTESDKHLQYDLLSGTPLFTLAEEYRNVLHHSMDPRQLADYMRMLRDGGYEPFVQLAQNSSTHEVLMPIKPSPKAQTDAQLFQRIAQTPLVTQEIRYTMPEAKEVLMVWGLNGWYVAPEELRPAGTELRPGGPKKAKLMHTPMIHHGDTFIIKVSVPMGTTIDYGFLITKTPGWFDITHPVWDGGYQAKALQTTSTPETKHSITEVKALLGRFPGLSEVRDDGLYFLAGIGAVLASWLSIFILLPLVER